MQCTVFGHWRSLALWRTRLLGEMTWRRVGVYLLGTSVWQGQLYLRRRRADTWPNTTLSLHWELAPSLPFENSTGLNPCAAIYLCIYTRAIHSRAAKCVGSRRWGFRKLLSRDHCKSKAACFMKLNLYFKLVRYCVCSLLLLLLLHIF
jgi:hypothetical protein